MMRKLGLVAGVALAALAFAVPVSAASAEWTHEGSPLTENAQVELEGSALFHLAGSSTGAEAIFELDATLIAGTTTAEITGLDETLCGGRGALQGLDCTSEPVGLPWVAHIDGDEVRITGIALHIQYYSPFDLAHETSLATTLVEGDMLADPDDPEAIGLVSLDDEGMTMNGNLAHVFGALFVWPWGTYGTT